mmetsp:Transcript_11265/g.15885  ORF Transcript_11265/g.15885 Transcript_11265/m.15885 type:complete len:463 (+) Transcript_11265:115-1503(+)
MNHRPLKSEKWRVRLVVRGDRLSYNEDSGSPAATMLETKLLINSVIFEAWKGARFLSLDLKDFFVATPMHRPEFMKIPLKYIPTDIMKRYNVKSLVIDGYIYVQINKGMYRLKQAAILAYNNLVSKLETYGYKPVFHNLTIWTHTLCHTQFCLCVDDFGVKYYNKDDGNHLINSLKHNYNVTVDWDGRHFCGFTFEWEYKKGYVNVSMPGYIKDVLKRFNHPLPSRPQYSPHIFQPVIYSKPGKSQLATTIPQSPPLDKHGIRFVQGVVGCLLYYARALDGTMLAALNEISTTQAKPTEHTLDKCKRLLDYAATYQNAYLRYYSSDMQLHIDSDAAYLVLPKAKSRVAGFFNLPCQGHYRKYAHRNQINSPILIECATLKHVVSSAAEAEVGGIFHNACKAIPIRRILKILGHKQKATAIKTNNSTAHGFVYDNINQRRSKSWDMRYYWLHNKQTQQQIDVY